MMIEMLTLVFLGPLQSYLLYRFFEFIAFIIIDPLRTFFIFFAEMTRTLLNIIQEPFNKISQMILDNKDIPLKNIIFIFFMFVVSLFIYSDNFTDPKYKINISSFLHTDAIKTYISEILPNQKFSLFAKKYLLTTIEVDGVISKIPLIQILVVCLLPLILTVDSIYVTFSVVLKNSFKKIIDDLTFIATFGKKKSLFTPDLQKKAPINQGINKIGDSTERNNSEGSNNQKVNKIVPELDKGYPEVQKQTSSLIS